MLKLKEDRAEQIQQAARREYVPTNYRSNISYSEMARLNNTSTQAPVQVTSTVTAPSQAILEAAQKLDINAEMKKYFNKDLSTCIDRMARFKLNFVTLTSDNERSTALMTLLSDICLN
jgi:hypothetical protein